MNQLDQTLTFLKEITDANAVPGQERQAREVMKKYIGDSADEIYQDLLFAIQTKNIDHLNHLLETEHPLF